MDGENTTMYCDHIHARSLDSGHHLSREWVKGFWARFRYEIPEGWRVCGENMYAKHSIFYDALPSYFLGFSIWNNQNECLSWDGTLDWFDLLGITPVPVIYHGMYDEQLVRELGLKAIEDRSKHEGYVVRITSQFPMDKFYYAVGKYVRKGHVQTDKLWMTQPVVPNKLLHE